MNREHPALFFKRPPRGESAHEQEGVTATYEKVSASSCSSHRLTLHHHIARFIHCYVDVCDYKRYVTTSSLFCLRDCQSINDYAEQSKQLD